MTLSKPLFFLLELGILFFFMVFLGACQNDCEPIAKNQVNFRFLQKNTNKQDTLNITAVTYTDIGKTDTTPKTNFSDFLLLDINPASNFTTYTFEGTRKNIPFSHTITLQYDKSLVINGNGKCGNVIKIVNLSVKNATFNDVIVRVSSLENEKQNQYDVGLFINP